MNTLTHSVTFGYETLNEALITSYDMESCASDLKRRFPSVVNVSYSTKNVYNRIPFYDDRKNHRTGTFFVSVSTIENIMDICDAAERCYGWFPVGVYVGDLFFIDWGRDGEFVCVNEGPFYEEHLYDYVKDHSVKSIDISFEAKFTVEVFPDELYHLTDLCILSKIKKNGLAPKTFGNFPERIYFGTDINAIQDMVGGKEGNNTLLRLNFDAYSKELKSKYKFYVDPRENTAVFTYDVISPKYIQLLVNETWINLEDYDGFPLMGDEYSTEDKVKVIVELVRRGFELMNAKPMTFKQHMSAFGYFIKYIPSFVGEYGNPYRIDTDKHILFIDQRYLSDNKGFNNFKDECSLSIYILFYVWASMNFPGAPQSVVDMYMKMSSENDRMNDEPLKMNSIVAHAAQIKYDKRAIDRSVDKMKRFSVNRKVYLVYDFLKKVAGCI